MTEEIKPSSPRKILLVDDNLVIQRSISLALKNKGYDVRMASEISEALTAVRMERPDLILLDLGFPIDPSNVGGPSRDGLFIIDWLQRTPETKTIPVIIISGIDPSKYKNHIEGANVPACFCKPVNNPEVLAAIQSALNASAAPVATALS